MAQGKFSGRWARVQRTCLEGHLLAKRGVPGTSELALRFGPWEKEGASDSVVCTHTGSATGKRRGSVEWEMPLTDWSHGCRTHLEGSWPDPTLRLRPQRTIMKCMVKSRQAAVDRGQASKRANPNVGLSCTGRLW